MVQEVGKMVNWMRLEKGLDLLEYGRFRKGGPVASYKRVNGKIILIGDYAFLFDMMLFLCDHSNILPYKYLFKQAIKLNDHILQKFQNNR